MTLLKAIGLAIVVSLVAGAVLAEALPGRFVPIDEGRFASSTWSLAAGANGEERCFRLTLDGSGGWSQAKVCDQNIPQFHFWDPLFGSSEDAATAVMSISAPQVWRVNLFLAHPGSGRKPNWHKFPMRLLSAEEAKRAHLKRDFRYAVLTGAGNLCVKKVRAFDRDGQLLEKRNSPCEY